MVSKSFQVQSGRAKKLKLIEISPCWKVVFILYNNPSTFIHSLLLGNHRNEVVVVVVQ